MRFLFLSRMSAGDRKCYNLIESDGNMLNTSLGGRKDLASNTLKGQGQQGRQRLLREGGTTTIPGLLRATDESLSHCLFILADNLPPPNAPGSSVGLHLWSYFGLTFRVSLRFISLFSSISSCSLRAAEKERTRVRLRVQTAANV